MRVHVGPPPSDPAFRPEGGGWTPMKEPSPLVLNLVSLPASLVAAVLVSALAGEARFSSAALPGGWDERGVPLAAGGAVIFGLVSLILMHEIIHGLAYPGFGTAVDVILGVWPSKLLFYAAATDPVSRDRMLAVYLAPLIFLSVVPASFNRLLDLQSLPLTLVAVVNAILSGGDATLVALILRQVPRRAMLRNKGWATWWRADAADGAEAARMNA